MGAAPPLQALQSGAKKALAVVIVNLWVVVFIAQRPSP